MADQRHPFHAVATLAATRDMDLRIKVENDGDYVHFYLAAPPLFSNIGLTPAAALTARFPAKADSAER